MNSYTIFGLSSSLKVDDTTIFGLSSILKVDYFMNSDTIYIFIIYLNWILKVYEMDFVLWGCDLGRVLI